jgi:hypothetical protein
MVDLLYREPTWLETRDARYKLLQFLIRTAFELEYRFLPPDISSEEGLFIIMAFVYLLAVLMIGSPRRSLVPIEEEKKLSEQQARIIARVSPRLKQLQDNFDNLTDAKVLEISQGATFYTVDSLIAVIGILLGRAPSFSSIITAAVLGGDTDSNGNIFTLLEILRS